LVRLGDARRGLSGGAGSAQTSRYEESIREGRREWIQRKFVAANGRCMICRRPQQACIGNRLDCHEMVSRARAPGRWWHPANALLLCRDCHDALPSLVQQLAWKLLHDPDDFDLNAVNQIKGGDPVRLASVVAMLRIIFGAP